MTKRERVLERALEKAVYSFMRLGRLNCHTLKCPERNTPSCKGKINICVKKHIAHFISKAKAEGMPK